MPKYKPHPLRAPKVEAGGDKLKYEPMLTIKVKAPKPKTRFDSIE